MATTEPTIDDVEQEDQPRLDGILPEYNGVQPVGVVSKVGGGAETISRAIDYGERVVVVIDGRLDDFAIKPTKQGPKLVQKIVVDDLYEIPGASGKRILAHLRQSYRTAQDARSGRRSLLGEDGGPVLGERGWMSPDGSVLTEEDLAEVRGDPILAAAADASLDPIVVVFDSGGRMVWPDEFGPQPGERPSAGDMLADSDGERQVRQVLSLSGELLEEWTDEQEDARLAALEEQFRAQEAAEDAAAVKELTDARERAQAAQPFPGYDTEPLARLKERVRDLFDVDVLREVGAYESAGKKRATVLKVAGERLAELEG